MIKLLLVQSHRLALPSNQPSTPQHNLTYGWQCERATSELRDGLSYSLGYTRMILRITLRVSNSLLSRKWSSETSLQDITTRRSESYVLCNESLHTQFARVDVTCGLLIWVYGYITFKHLFSYQQKCTFLCLHMQILLWKCKNIFQAVNVRTFN